MEKSIAIIECLFEETYGITEKDKENLKKFLDIFDSKMKLNMFKENYRNNEDTKKVIEDIDKKIDELQERLKEEPKELIFLLPTKEKLTKDILEETLQNLIDLKNSIINDKSEYLIAQEELINDKINKLIDECIQTTIIGQNRLLNFFGKPIASKNSSSEKYTYTLNEETINKVFKILSDKNNFDELKRELPIKEKKALLREEMYCYELVLATKEILNKYIINQSERDQIETDIQSLNEERNEFCKLLAENEELENTTNIFTKLFNKKKRHELPTKIYYRYDYYAFVDGNTPDELLANLRNLTHKKEEQLVILEEQAIQYMNEIKKQAPSLSHSEQTHTYLMETEKNKFESIVTKSDEELTNHIKTLRGELNSLPNHNAAIDYETSKNIMVLATEPERYECTPLISFYILKALIDCQTTELTNYKDRYNLEAIKLSQEKIITMINEKYSWQLVKLINIDEYIEESLANKYTRVKKKTDASTFTGPNVL